MKRINKIKKEIEYYYSSFKNELMYLYFNTKNEVLLSLFKEIRQYFLDNEIDYSRKVNDTINEWTKAYLDLLECKNINNVSKSLMKEAIHTSEYILRRLKDNSSNDNEFLKILAELQYIFEKHDKDELSYIAYNIDYFLKRIIEYYEEYMSLNKENK